MAPIGLPPPGADTLYVCPKRGNRFGSNTRLLMTVYVGYSMMEVVSKSSPAEFSWNSKNLRALSVTAISATAAT